MQLIIRTWSEQCGFSVNNNKINPFRLSKLHSENPAYSLILDLEHASPKCRFTAPKTWQHLCQFIMFIIVCKLSPHLVHFLYLFLQKKTETISFQFIILLFFKCWTISSGFYHSEFYLKQWLIRTNEYMLVRRWFYLFFTI